MGQIGSTEGGAQGEGQPPSASVDGAKEAAENPPVSPTWRNTSSQRQTTRGGAGSAAGATPKKTYRPSASSRPRPAGKKPHGHG